MEKDHNKHTGHKNMEKEHTHANIHKKLSHNKKIKINFLKNFKGVKLINLLAVSLGLLLIVNLFLAFGLKDTVKAKVEEIKELTKPAKIQLAIIENFACNDCFDLNEVISVIKKNNVNVTGEETLGLN